MKVFVYLNLLIFVNCNEGITDFISTIITNSFQKYTTLIYISDGPKISPFIEKVLIEKESTIILPNSKTFHTFNSSIFRIFGTIISTSNFTYLKCLFDGKSGARFTPHERVLIFFEGEANFYDYPFNVATDLQGVDLITVEYNIKDQVWAESQESKIRVTSINKNKTILEWNLFENYNFYTEDFDMTEWEPKYSPAVHRLNFRASLFDCPPFVYVNQQDEAHDGIEYRIIQHVMAKWPIRNIVHKYAPQSDLYSDVKLDVFRGISDVAVCSHWITLLAKYSDTFETTIPYTQTCITFLVPKPHALPDYSFVYQPLSTQMWIIEFLLLFIATTVLYCLGKYYLIHRDLTNIFSDLASDFIYIIRMYTLGSLNVFPQPALLTIRIFVTSWSLYVLLITTGYSAGYTSILTSIRYSKPINTLQDMVDHGISWGGPNANTKNMFPDNTEVFKKLSDNYKIEATHSIRDERIRMNNYAVITKKLAQYYLTDTETLDDYGKTHLKVISECAGEYGVVFVLQKNSPYKRMFDVQITRLSEHGIIQYWNSMMLNSYNLEYLQNFFTSRVLGREEFSKPLTVGRLMGNFYLWGVGNLLALLTFIAECYSKNVKQILNNRIHTE